MITGETILAHGFRLACGSNHFFRVNTSRRDSANTQASDALSPVKKEKTPLSTNSSWEEAQRELALKGGFTCCHMLRFVPTPPPLPRT
jgi:hypothetical protein